MKRPIYLDYMATTPIDDIVIKKMLACMGYDGAFGNPASVSHYYGFEAGELVTKARQQVATAIGADSREIIWTSGATESDNLAIKGTANFYQRQAKHIITMATEHKAVLDTCRFLELQGFELTILNPDETGRLDLELLKSSIRPDTSLISIMFVNNETGVIQDIAAIGQIAREQGVKFHVDATQAIGKLPVDVTELDVDLMSFSAHKVYGPKGIGAIYVRRNPRTRLQPLQHGGAHEQGIRSGTLPTHQIVGMGAAFELAIQKMPTETPRIMTLADRLWSGISKLEGVYLNGSINHKIPHCLNVRFDGIDGEALMVALRDIAVSAGSACTSANPKPSHVLTAYGLNRTQANQSLRFSVGRYTQMEDVEFAVSHVIEQVQRLRKMSPVWDKVQQKLSEE